MSEARILVGDCRDTLKTLPDGSVQCCITSPPYYGLRDYGTAEWDGGDPECDHKETTARNDGGRVNTSGFPGSARPDSDKGAMNFRDTCRKCGANRIDRQIGLEATPDEYVAALVGVFREVRRVLRDDGTVWLNLGDSYASGTGGDRNEGAMGRQLKGRAREQTPGLKPKDLIGIPWRVAFALQADGWWLRSDIIWSKPNPMPESVTDRPTKSHEYVFLLSKSERYFYDADAIAEPADTAGQIGGFSGSKNQSVGIGRKPSGNQIPENDRNYVRPSTRNARTVWTITTQPYAEAHFATFPEELARRCIVAGTSQRGACPTCGAPWERVVERAESPDVPPSEIDRYGTGEAGVHRRIGGQYQKWMEANPKETTGWRPTCEHEAEPVPCVVLDPFGGSGTVAAVAVGNGRSAILCELNPEYTDMAVRRIGPMWVAP